ncbi:MAG: DUF4412 domain-containing protein [Bacteroidia bacterium]|nr:DUF4412 domain-containing protein [Bacteroidia bacterium]
MKKALFTAAILISSITVNAQWKGSYTMIIEPHKAKEAVTAFLNFMENKMAMEMAMGKDASVVRSIFDFKNNTITTTTEKEGSNKFAMVMKLREDVLEKSNEDVQFKTTEEQRTIDGYLCTKVIAETKDGITEMWLTRDLNLSYENTIGMMPKTKNNPTSGFLKDLKQWKGIEGFPIEMISYQKKKPEEKSSIRFKDIKSDVVNEKAFDLSGFQVMDMTQMLKGK